MIIVPHSKPAVVTPHSGVFKLTPELPDDKSVKQSDKSEEAKVDKMNRMVVN